MIVLYWCLDNAAFIAAIVALFVPFVMHFLDKRYIRHCNRTSCLCEFADSCFSVKPIVDGFNECHLYGEDSHLYFRSMVMYNLKCYSGFRRMFCHRFNIKLFKNVDCLVFQLRQNVNSFSEPRPSGWCLFSKLLSAELELLKKFDKKWGVFVENPT